MPNKRYSRNRTALETVDAHASDGGRAYGDIVFHPDLIVGDATNPPTAAVTGTAGQSQYDTLAFDITAINANDVAYINIDLPADYLGDPSIDLYFQVNAVAGQTDWRHTWRRTPPNATAVLDAAGTAGTAVRTTVPTTANFLSKSTITPPAAVTNLMIPGDHVLVQVVHDNDSTSQPTAAILLVKAVFVYRRG